MTWPVSNTATVASDAEVAPLTGESLVEKGAAPVQADPNAIMAQLQAQVAEQQKLIERMAAERGVPLNERDVYLNALHDHVVAQANANPVHKDDYSVLRELLSDLVHTPDNTTIGRVEYLREIIDDLRELHPQHELAYVKELGRTLWRHLRDKAAE